MHMIAHSKPTISSKDALLVQQVLKSGHLAQGTKVVEFESAVSQYLGLKDGVAVSSGTNALHLALLALNIARGDEVIIPSFVCSSLWHAVSYTGATARVVDVNLEDGNISVSQVKKIINKKVKAIIVPHMFGCPADIKELLALGVPIIEDCAQSIGAEYMQRKVGSFGALSVCSFYATKMMTTGEGGMVLSNQVKLIERVRDLRQYDKASDKQVRYNYKMTEFQAALGSSQLQQLPRFIEQRRRIADQYRHAFQDLNVVLLLQDRKVTPIYYRYVIKVKKNADVIIRKLNEKGICAAKAIFKPLHHFVAKASCPNTHQLMSQCVSIPIYPNLSKLQIQSIIHHVRGVIKNLTKTTSVL